jgi:aminomethyltransferase
VNATLSNDLGRIGPGKAQYTLCCDDGSGGVVDDLIAYYATDDEIFMIPNAANTAEVVRRLQGAAPEGIEVRDLHEDFAVLAVQGPGSDEVLGKLGLPTGSNGLEHEALDYMSFAWHTWEGKPVTVCRTGYTGERGYELVPQWDDAPALWDAILAAGEPVGIRPCGLAARDTLRTEMGYPLHGQDLSLDITPVQARCGWAVGWKKPQFWGRDVLLAEKEAGARRLLWGLEGLERAIPRPHMSVGSGCCRRARPAGALQGGQAPVRQGVDLGLSACDLTSSARG